MTAKTTLLRRKGLFEKLALSVIIALGIPAVIYVKLVDPAFSSYRAYTAETASLEQKSELLRKQLSAALDPKAKKKAEKPDIYLLHYLEKMTDKSDIKLKSFQASGAGVSKGIASFQMRFACNVDTFDKFLYMTENTFPPLAVSNWRVSSLSGGSYSGMRQLEGTATISFLTAGAGTTASFADLKKLKGYWRDVFAEMPVDAPKPPPPPPAEPEEKEPEPVIKWSLTAQMSDGESDLIVVTNSLTNQRVTADLKTGGFSAVVTGESVEISGGDDKVTWKLGESLEQDKLPPKLKELITAAKDGVVPAKTAVDTEKKAPEPEVKEDKVDDTQAPATPKRGGRRRARTEE